MHVLFQLKRSKWNAENEFWKENVSEVWHKVFKDDFSDKLAEANTAEETRAESEIGLG